MPGAGGMILPLPPGEGRGEGNRTIESPSFTDTHLARPAIIRQRVRGAFLQRPPDCIPNNVFFAPQPRIPEPQHFDSAFSQKRIALTIPGLLLRFPMLKAVNLNVQFGFETEKIQNIWPVRMLSSELVVGKAAVAQPALHQLFRPRVLLAQRARELRRTFGFGGINWFMNIHGPPVGRVKKNVAPLPGSLFTQTLPPWFCTMCLTMDKPRPVPPCSRERALSTR